MRRARARVRTGSAGGADRRTGRGRAGRRLPGLGLLVLAGGAAALAGPTGAPPDAVILVWEQHWALEADGTTVYQEKRHVRLDNERAYGEFADPRITYNVETEELEILAARTRRPDGSCRELPDYARVVVGPDASAGWPAFASLHQQLLVLSGIEPGCVVELEYRLRSRPGARPQLAADVRLDHRYPVRERIVSLRTPAGAPPAAAVLNLPGGAAASPEVERAGGYETRTWRFGDLPAHPDEPQAPAWQVRCPRLVFATAGGGAEWLRQRLGQLEQAADRSDLVRGLAAEWAKDPSDPGARLRALQGKLAASFSFVSFPVEWRPAGPRRAAEVLDSNYGLPEEAAVALLALARAAELPVRPGLLVADEIWHEAAAQDAMVAAYVVVLDGGAGVEIWDPQHGRILRDGRWAGHTLLAERDGQVQRMPLPAWTAADGSACRVSGKLTIAADGVLAGELVLRATGLFVSAEGLRSADAQRGRIGALLGRVVPEAQVESFTVKTLTVGEFEAAAQVRSAGPLARTAGCCELALAQDGPLAADVPLPLAHGRRGQPVCVPGPCEELVELVLVWPQAWSVEALPQSRPEQSGAWGAAGQVVTRTAEGLTLRRHARIAESRLAPDAFLELREALNGLRSPAARTLLLKP